MYQSLEYVEKLVKRTVPSMRYDGTETYESWKKRAVQEGYCAVVLEQRYIMGSCGQLKDGAPLCARRNTALPALLLGRTDC